MSQVDPPLRPTPPPPVSPAHAPPTPPDVAPPPGPPHRHTAPMDELSAAKAALLAEAQKPSGPSFPDKAMLLVRERPYVALGIAAALGGFLGFNKGARRIVAAGAAFGVKNLIGRVLASKLR